MFTSLNFIGGKLSLDVSLPSAAKQIQEMLLSPSTTTIRGTTIGALRKKLRELQRIAQRAKGSAHTQLTPLVFNVHGGERILCLDGGGIKGLIQVEVLMQIEEMTGRRIIELFDWIVGTSIGGIVALGMIYGMLCMFIPTHSLLSFLSCVQLIQCVYSKLISSSLI